MTGNNNLEISGNLGRSPLAELLVEIFQLKLNGSLRISKEKQKLIIYFDNGKVVFAVSNLRCHKLFEILLNQDQITKLQLSKIENFTNDLYLAQTLVKQEILKKEDIDSFFAFQITKIIESVLELESGQWVFSPAARIKEGLKFEVNIKPVLYRWAKNINQERILSRFKSFGELFWLVTNSPEISFELTPEESFILSRLTEKPVSIEQLISISGLANNQVMLTLYKLWIGGVVLRGNWNSAFNQNDITKLNSAKLKLKTSAISVEEEQQKAKEAAEAEVARIEEEERQKKLEEARKQAKEKQQITLTLEDYIKRIDDAATHYEIFNVAPDSHIDEIKKVYFTLAKKFHPDLYHKKVSSKLLTKIQNAFTEIAQAYETLKDPEAREVYDFKLRKVLDKIRKEQEASGVGYSEDAYSNQATLASENFDNGYDLLMRQEVEESLPYLGRAVHLDSQNARYQAFYGKALSFDKSKHHDAETHLQNAIKLAPDNTVYRIMLVELFTEIGLNVRAKGELKRILNIDPNHKEAISLLDSLNNK